ncbi:hypothetical protein B0I35DRAFT_3896 [Stachybotrys elegans]|uniref:Uncharacterized protein n=1 Tax=Stachybotrys elegans TaxID=80388 RepID=A0A8K0WWY6_9HYPO|nr:hypothetical protein B0I35DRAFT_3896 [Stachybotrys elegans]
MLGLDDWALPPRLAGPHPLGCKTTNPGQRVDVLHHPQTGYLPWESGGAMAAAKQHDHDAQAGPRRPRPKQARTGKRREAHDGSDQGQQPDPVQSSQHRLTTCSHDGIVHGRAWQCAEGGLVVRRYWSARLTPSRLVTAVFRLGRGFPGVWGLDSFSRVPHTCWAPLPRFIRYFLYHVSPWMYGSGFLLCAPPARQALVACSPPRSRSYSALSFFFFFFWVVCLFVSPYLLQCKTVTLAVGHLQGGAQLSLSEYGNIMRGCV